MTHQESFRQDDPDDDIYMTPEDEAYASSADLDLRTSETSYALEDQAKLGISPNALKPLPRELLDLRRKRAFPGRFDGPDDDPDKEVSRKRKPNRSIKRTLHQGDASHDSDEDPIEGSDEGSGSDEGGSDDVDSDVGSEEDGDASEVDNEDNEDDNTASSSFRFPSEEEPNSSGKASGGSDGSDARNSRKKDENTGDDDGDDDVRIRKKTLRKDRESARKSSSREHERSTATDSGDKIGSSLGSSLDDDNDPDNGDDPGDDDDSDDDEDDGSSDKADNSSTVQQGPGTGQSGTSDTSITMRGALSWDMQRLFYDRWMLPDLSRAVHSQAAAEASAEIRHLIPQISLPRESAATLPRERPAADKKNKSPPLEPPLRLRRDVEEAKERSYPSDDIERIPGFAEARNQVPREAGETIGERVARDVKERIRWEVARATDRRHDLDSPSNRGQDPISRDARDRERDQQRSLREEEAKLLVRQRRSYRKHVENQAAIDLEEKLESFGVGLPPVPQDYGLSPRPAWRVLQHDIEAKQGNRQNNPDAVSHYVNAVNGYMRSRQFRGIPAVGPIPEPSSPPGRRRIGARPALNVQEAKEHEEQIAGNKSGRLDDAYWIESRSNREREAKKGKERSLSPSVVRALSTHPLPGRNITIHRWTKSTLPREPVPETYGLPSMPPEFTNVAGYILHLHGRNVRSRSLRRFELAVHRYRMTVFGRARATEALLRDFQARQTMIYELPNRSESPQPLSQHMLQQLDSVDELEKRLDQRRFPRIPSIGSAPSISSMSSYLSDESLVDPEENASDDAGASDAEDQSDTPSDTEYLADRFLEGTDTNSVPLSAHVEDELEKARAETREEGRNGVARPLATLCDSQKRALVKAREDEASETQRLLRRIAKTARQRELEKQRNVNEAERERMRVLNSTVLNNLFLEQEAPQQKSPLPEAMRRPKLSIGDTAPSSGRVRGRRSGTRSWPPLQDPMQASTRRRVVYADEVDPNSAWAQGYRFRSTSPLPLLPLSPEATRSEYMTAEEGGSAATPHPGTSTGESLEHESQANARSKRQRISTSSTESQSTRETKSMSMSKTTKRVRIDTTVQEHPSRLPRRRSPTSHAASERSVEKPAGKSPDK